ncbi:AEC family transporter [Alcaligenaceae bacterium SJ-26]|nr:AEC family transporter [Alcaligenaceae bacterium SJ-26]
MSTFLLVLPDFMLILLGWLLRHRLGFERSFFMPLERLIYYVLFPALLFQATLRAPIVLSDAINLIGATLALLATGILLAQLARPLLRLPAFEHACVAQCGYRFNTYLGLAIAFSLAGTRGQSIMAIIIGLAVPVVNAAAVFGLARTNGGSVGRELLRNPLLLATVLGLAGNMLGLHLPGPIEIFASKLGAAAIALGIVCVGANLSWEGGKGQVGTMTWMIAVKLIAMPALAWPIGLAFGLPAVEQAMLLLFATLPTASSAYILAIRMGGDGRAVALLISTGTLLSALTIPLWLLMLPAGIQAQ